MILRRTDRRTARRAEVLGDLLLEISHEKSSFRGDAMNLSDNGINFLSLVSVPLFREVDVRLKLPGNNEKKTQTVRCHAVVVRCEKRVHPFYEVSVFFVDLPKNGKTKITKYIRHVVSPQSCQDQKLL